MSVSLGDITLFLRVDDSRLDSTLKGVEGKTTSWVNSLGGKLALGLGGIVTAAIGGAVALGVTAFKAGESLDAAYDTLLTKTGASGEALNQLQQDFKAVFSSVPTEAQPLADVLSLLHERTTLVGKDNQDLSKQLLESARIMGGDAKTNAELYTRMMGDWSISNEDAAGGLDKVFIASQKTGIGMDRLMGLAVQFGSPMRLMGFTLDDTIALLSKWEKEGVNTELVMGSLRIAAGHFADQGKPLRESLMSTFDSIKNNKDATAALAEGMDVFGARAGPDMVAAIREGRFSVDDLVASLQNGDGAIAKTAQATMDWGEKLTILKNKATLALAPLGMKLMDVASILLDKAGPALDKFAGIVTDYVVPAIDSIFESFRNFDGDPIGAIADILYKLGYNLETVFGIQGANDFFSNVADGFISLSQTIGAFVTDTLIPFVTEHGPLLKDILVGITAGFAAFTIITTVVGWITGLIAVISGAGAAFAVAGGGIAGIVAILGGPVTLVIAAVVAAIALLGAAWAGNWGGIQEKTAAVMAFIQGLIDSGMQFINDLVNGRLGLLSLIFSAVWENIQLIFQAFQAAFSGDWYRFGELLRMAWNNAWTLIKLVFSTAWDNIKASAKEGVQTVKDFFTKTDWGSVGTSILEGIAKGITAGLRIIRDAAIGAAQAALQAAQGFLGIKSPSTVFAEEVGKPSAEGFGKGFAKRMGEIGTGTGQEALGAFNGVQPTAGAGGGAIQFTYVDQRFISLSDEFEAERILRPLFERMMRGAAVPA